MMLKTLLSVSAYLTITLGLAHIAFAPFAYGRLTAGALWFIGSGVAVVLAGLLNLILVRAAGADRVVDTICLVANAIAAVLFMVAAYVLFEPQALIGLALSAFQTAAAFSLRRRRPAKQVYWNSNLHE